MVRESLVPSRVPSTRIAPTDSSSTLYRAEVLDASSFPSIGSLSLLDARLPSTASPSSFVPAVSASPATSWFSTAIHIPSSSAKPRQARASPPANTTPAFYSCPSPNLTTPSGEPYDSNASLPLLSFPSSHTPCRIQPPLTTPLRCKNTSRPGPGQPARAFRKTKASFTRATQLPPVVPHYGSGQR